MPQFVFMAAMASPPWTTGRPRRSGAARRAQEVRAQGRAIQKFLGAMEELVLHRGCQPSRLGAVLAQLLRADSVSAGVQACSPVTATHTEPHLRADAKVFVPFAHAMDMVITTVMEVSLLQPPASDWTSPVVPSTIRRPWGVLEDAFGEMSEANDQGRLAETAPLWERMADVAAHLRERAFAVRDEGYQAVFMGLPKEQRRPFVDISLGELAAYVCWRRSVPASSMATWDLLNCEEMGEWLPDDPRAVLVADEQCGPLLDD